MHPVTMWESKMDYFIHPFSKQTKQTFLNICTVLKKTWSPKMFVLSANWAIPGLQLGLGSRFPPEMWVSLEVKGRGWLIGLSTTPALPACGSGQGAGWEVPWHLHRLILGLTVSRGKQTDADLESWTTVQQKRRNIDSDGFPVQFEVNRIFVFSVSPWLVLLVIL